jgi:Tfp pilus assembly PilM family ATPase
VLAELIKRLKRETTMSPIGLDVGPRHIRAAQLERRGGMWKVLRLTALCRREVEEGDVVSTGFARRLGETIRQSGYVGRRVVAGLSIPEVDLHPLEIPTRGDLADEDRFREAVGWELERVSALKDEQVATSFWKLPSADGSRATTIGAVASGAVVRRAYDMVTTAGLDCECVDATACGLSRLGAVARRGLEEETESIWAILDIGFRMSRLTLCVGEAPVLVRTLGGGSQAWTERIAASLGLSEEAAEVHKIEHGIATQSEEGWNEPGQPEVAEIILELLRSELELIINEIERSYEYVMRCYPERGAAGLLVVGGGADMKGL